MPAWLVKNKWAFCHRSDYMFISKNYTDRTPETFPCYRSSGEKMIDVFDDLTPSSFYNITSVFNLHSG